MSLPAGMVSDEMPAVILTFVSLFIYFLLLFLIIFIYLVALGLSCGMQTLSCTMHVGSRFLTRDRTCTPCIGSMEY